MPVSTTKPPAPTSATKPPVRRRPAPPRQISGGGSRSPPPAPPVLRALPWLRSMSDLPAALARLLETTTTTTTDGAVGADVEFEVGGKVFTAHKLVLAARSPVFREQFFGAAKEEATGYVRIYDMHPDTFEALLHYVYTDSLPPPAVLVPVTRGAGRGGARREEEAPAAAAVLVQDLLRAADRYGLRGLKSLAETQLCRRNNVVGVDTVLPMLALAERHQCWELKNRCLEFIASGENARAVMAATDDVEHLARSCPSLVKELVEILEAKEKAAATTSRRRPLMDSADALFFLFLALGFILACILPLRMWGFFEQK
ncbi:hypothetical protein BDA96_02G027900 [Sorghum bicolor]|uniref:BTB domain-containing protein n=1 Tax=Sorghum bicolor TaxID=4558 RepID=A0A921USI0_SORBI|nr:hypothetical protein BDA96_02G027900 [Sorghum bicolor]